MLGTFPRLSEAKRVIIDIECYDPLLKDKGVSYVYGLGYILGIGIKLDNEPASYYPLGHKQEGNYSREQVFRYLCDIPDRVDCVFHNAVYDVGWLSHDLEWLHAGKFRDTLIMAQLDNNSRPSFSLDNLSKELALGEKIEVDPTKLYLRSINDVARYCCHDIELTAKLDDKLWRHRDTDAANREFALIPILVKMKQRGVKFNPFRLNALEKQFKQQLSQEMYECGIHDIWANQRIMELFNRLNISFPRTKPTRNHSNGYPSFPKWFLESVDHPQIKALAKARQLHRLINTFCKGIMEQSANSRVHPDFWNGKSEYGGTVTGRFSSSHPNMQQIPHRTEEGNQLRSVFIPDDDQILFKFDYKQQEPILMLHYASKLRLKDIEKWKEIYKNPDADFYVPIQEAMQIERFYAKTITLATCYNMGPEKLSRMMHIDMKQSVEYLMGFRNIVPWLKELKDHCVNMATSRGWIKTLGDRQLHFSRQNVSDSFNHLIQGSAADQTKQAMIEIYKQLGLVPLLQVHDELLYELNKDQINQELHEDIKVIMEDVFDLDFPVRVDMKPGLSWKQCG